MFLKGTPAFLSIAAATTSLQHVRNLEDDLESLLYIVLYCALLWLPVDSPSRPLDLWLTKFFYLPEGGLLDGPDPKILNAQSRQWTKRLSSERSQAVLDWLNAAMDLHFHRIKWPNPAGPNPAWVGGKALGEVWREALVMELPEDDRRVNPIPGMVLPSELSLHATYTAHTVTPTDREL